MWLFQMGKHFLSQLPYKAPSSMFPAKERNLPHKWRAPHSLSQTHSAAATRPSFTKTELMFRRIPQFGGKGTFKAHLPILWSILVIATTKKGHGRPASKGDWSVRQQRRFLDLRLRVRLKTDRWWRSWSWWSLFFPFRSNQSVCGLKTLFNAGC